jgi:hypothetical protein
MVGKLDLLTAGVHLELTEEQQAKIAATLADIDQVDELTDDDAKEVLDSIRDVLSDEQKDSLASIDLPRRGGGRGGAPGGGMGMGASGGTAKSKEEAGKSADAKTREGMTGMGAGPMMTGSTPPSGPSNPFKSSENEARLKRLRDRLNKSMSDK